MVLLLAGMWFSVGEDEEAGAGLVGGGGGRGFGTGTGPVWAGLEGTGSVWAGTSCRLQPAALNQPQTDASTSS